MLIATLIGRAAEETIVGSVTASSGGAEFSDLARATEIAFDMEATLGFSQKWPLLHRKANDRTSLLSIDPELAARVNARLECAYSAAKSMALREQAAIEYLAAILLDRGTLCGQHLEATLAEVRQLMATHA